MLVQWQNVENFAILPHFRDTSYEKIPNWWDRNALLRSMPVTSPSVLAYHTGQLLFGSGGQTHNVMAIARM